MNDLDFVFTATPLSSGLCLCILTFKGSTYVCEADYSTRLTVLGTLLKAIK